MNRRTILALIIATLIAGSLADQSSIDDFKRRIFKFINKEPGIYELDVGFNENTQHWVAAFGDIDQTSYTDVILTDKEAKVLSLYTWSSKKASKYSRFFNRI